LEPQFFDMIGLDTSGLTFERIFWVLVFTAGVVVLVRESLAKREMGDAWYGYAIGAGLTIYGGYYAYKALFRGELYFAEDGLRISNYGLAIAVAFVVGIYLAVREAGRTPGDPLPGHIFDVAFWILIASMVGSRVLFIIVGWQDYVNLCIAPELVEGSGGVADCFAVLKFWKGGLVFFGGFLGAAGATLYYCRKHRLSFLQLSDILIPSVALGHFFGRIGCLSAGCCFGRPESGALSVLMPVGSAAYQAQREGIITTQYAVDFVPMVEAVRPNMVLQYLQRETSLHIHPTQLFEASWELMLFGLLILFVRPRKRFHGQLLATWLVLYSCMRFVVEFVRGDKIRGYLFEVTISPINELLGIPTTEPTLLTTSQVISMATLAAGVWLLFKNRRRRPV